MKGMEKLDRAMILRGRIKTYDQILNDPDMTYIMIEAKNLDEIKIEKEKLEKELRELQ